ncbi:MBL fold metallo-hydrolase [Maritalea sp.]|uniref:MBL fold metallo-hydrolase n=1 Tax=Maritalea sp. TaxID=2003361 RepID=UPI003EF27527
MQISKRQLLKSGAVLMAGITFIPFNALADGHADHQFGTNSGKITVHPISHASIVLETPAGVIYVDPVGDAAQYASHPKPDLVLVTHQHGDHYNAETLAAIVGENTKLITNPAVFEMLPAALKENASQLAIGGTIDFAGAQIDAIPAYNTTEGRKNFHPEGRDNGYVLSIDGTRIYISGDTEDIPEMRALQNIDIAFICMNLPFTMDINAAASAVAEFKPKYVYPYHYRGRDDGTQDPKEFAKLVGEMATVKFGNWYG